jgi:hypothetical protein
MEPIFEIIGVVIIILVIWFIAKQVEYFFISVKLFKKMIQLQEDMMKLLLDIRDNTKSFKPEIPEVIECPHCKATLKLNETERQTRNFNCPNCKKEIIL